MASAWLMPISSAIFLKSLSDKVNSPRKASPRFSPRGFHLLFLSMAKFFANLDPCLIGMEACGSAHHWARKLGGFGHTVKLIAPQFVNPYVKTSKNDMADAEAICEADRE